MTKKMKSQSNHSLITVSTYRCNECGAEFERIDDEVPTCDCGSDDVELLYKEQM